MDTKSLNICILHLDLGQGGAERQTIDEALALKSLGHKITIYTSHHDRNRCFAETIDNKLLGNCIKVHGDWIPRNIFGKLHALMSIFRLLWCILLLLIFDRNTFDIVFIDQVSHVIPFLRFLNSKIVYYCHFPDMLLVVGQKKSILKSIYRLIINWVEKITTVNCDVLLCNSQFTKSVIERTFCDTLEHVPELKAIVVYPAIDINQYQNIVQFEEQKKLQKKRKKRLTFLSINRYERKKEIDLAIHALFLLRKKYPKMPLKLIIAGGYDERLVENVEYMKELKHLCIILKMKYQCIDQQKLLKFDYGMVDNLILDHSSIDTRAVVYFIVKFPDVQKEALLKECCAVLYTPQNEHFGIVPIEAMLAMRPVIACNCGGPLETIVHGKTGFLCESNAEQWANAMEKFVENVSEAEKLENIQQFGSNGRQHVVDHFSHYALQEQLKIIVQSVITQESICMPSLELKMYGWLIVIVTMMMFVGMCPVLLLLNCSQRQLMLIAVIYACFLLQFFVT